MSLAIAGIAALAACGGGGNTNPNPPNPGAVATQPPTTTSSDPTLPQQATVSGKTFWESKGGLPLYTFGGDSNGVSNCTGTCATIWPPLMAGANSVATGAFTIVTRTNPSGSQWAYNGMPLYTFASDKAGQAPTGNGVENFSLAIVNGQSGGAPPPSGCTGIYC